ncbi:MAG: sialidase family protein [Verrucomicrobiales bacterium]
MPAFAAGQSPGAASADSPGYDLSRVVSAKRFDGGHCYSHPRAGIVPAAGEGGAPAVVMLMNTLRLTGSDIFENNLVQRTDDLGKTWTEPRECERLAPRRKTIDGEPRWVVPANLWPAWHRSSGALLATGLDVVYTSEWHVAPVRPQHAVYAVYDASGDRWRSARILRMPEGFVRTAAGSTQRYDLPDGTILLPVHYRSGDSDRGDRPKVTVVQCSFDGQTLEYEGHGEDIGIDDDTRGLFEPSLTRFEDTYFMTIRHEQHGFATRSRDGLNFEPIRRWTFDDGTDLGSYNTQAHWVTHSDGLFLVYTRRGAGNDHVFRHRAPLFMAQVDPERLCVLRETEQVIVPERGARLGNFGVTHVSPEETWITVAEWMQPKGAETHGSDGSVFVARIHWENANAAF